MLLFFTFFSVFAIPFFPDSWHGRLYTYSISIVVITGILAVDRFRRGLFGLGLVAVVLDIVTDSMQNDVLNQLSRGINLIFFIMVIVLFLCQIARRNQVTPQVILEAINGYLMLGLCFSVLVALTMRLDPGSFNFPAVERDTMHFNNLYFAFVTMSTLGYGEIVPETPGAKALSILISVTGQLYLAVVMALLVGKYVGYWSARRTLDDESSIKERKS